MLSTRQREPEIMDNLELDEHEHVLALRGLARLNACSGSVWALWRPVRQLASRLKRKQLRILDVATGGADVPIALWELGQRAGFELQIDGCDINERAVEVAQQATQKAGAPSSFFKLDVIKDRLPAGYDVVISSLFTHHLSEDESVELLAKMRDSARYMVVLNDLVRSVPSLVMVSMASRMLSRSHVVHFDGAASVRSAYTPSEWKELARRAQMPDAHVYEQFPCRMMLVWERESQ